MYNLNELNVYGSYSTLFNFNSNPASLDSLLKDKWFDGDEKAITILGKKAFT